MGSEQKVSIVITCYNYAEYLPDAIQSCLDQTVPVEVIVVNDGSPDHTSEVAKQFPVKLIEQDNKGLPAARNAGIKAALGEWIICLDADDKLDEECAEKCLAAEGDIIAPGQQNFGDENIFFPLTNRSFSYQSFLECNQVHCACMFKKSMWQALGGYDEAMTLGYEDWEFWLRAAKAGYTFKVVSEPLFFYRKHGYSAVSRASENQKEIINYIRTKHNGESNEKAC